jgi:hypothetical protein
MQGVPETVCANLADCVKRNVDPPTTTLVSVAAVGERTQSSITTVAADIVPLGALGKKPNLRAVALDRWGRPDRSGGS